MSRFTGNDLMLYAGLGLLFSGLTAWFGWPVAAVAVGSSLIVIGVSNAYFVTWLSARVERK